MYSTCDFTSRRHSCGRYFHSNGCWYSRLFCSDEWKHHARALFIQSKSCIVRFAAYSVFPARLPPLMHRSQIRSRIFNRSRTLAAHALSIQGHSISASASFHDGGS